MSFDDLQTPCLLLDRPRMRGNLDQMANHVAGLGGCLRPHAKTHKSVDVWKEVVVRGPVKGVTVSTLAEARYFFAAGERDILYAVGISPNKFDEAAALIKEGCQLTVTLDSVEAGDMLSAYCAANGLNMPVVIEVDVDGHRAGVAPQDDRLIDIAKTIRGGARLVGVMTHAGESYECDTPETLVAAADQERDLTVHAAARLRDAGFGPLSVSIGSTPTISSIKDLSGVDEVRPGVYTFHDLVMRGLGVCKTNDIAISVLATIIGHQTDRNWVIVDAGWMAMSRDRGTSGQSIDYGYGEVCGLACEPIGDLIVGRANQEHGVVLSRTGRPIPFDAFPIGGQLRILPNHACATAAQYDRYVVTEGREVVAEWGRMGGW